jgi:hypothetical protein
MTPLNNMRPSESGSVFVIVMLGVVLFSALMFVFSRGARQGGEDISDRQIKLAVTDMISYAQQLERGVDRIMNKGRFSEVDISFENEYIATYVNPNCTVEECRVFSPQGGTVTWRAPPAGVNNGEPYLFTANKVGSIDDVYNVGTPETDLVLILAVNRRACDIITEEMFKLPAVESSGGTSFASFTGSYNVGGASINRSWSPIEHAGCFCDGPGGAACTTGNGNLYFYYVLYGR